MSLRSHLVVFEDDPTGVQTVHGSLLLTCWDEQTLDTAFRDACPFFHILTNTRAYSRAQAQEIVSDAAANTCRISKQNGQLFVAYSRSDSTLRGHFPVEVETINRVMQEHRQREPDAVFVAPALFEAGRVTADDIHYLLTDGRRIPTCETEFARDSVFGYSTSHLPSYIEEKTGGRVSRQEVASVPLELLRQPGTERLETFLGELRGGRYVVVNAENYADLNRFAQAFWAQQQRGRHFLLHGAASLVKALAGIPSKPYIGRETLCLPGPGLFIVGSHVQRTTRQLERLLASPQVRGMELDASAILESEGPLLETTLKEVTAILRAGLTPVVYTSRSELRFDSTEARLAAGLHIARFLARLIHELPEPPAYIVAKGGITSCEVLVHGLRARMARVLGPVQPGVPAVIASENARYRNTPYIIYPGNVGSDETLVALLAALGQR